MFDLCGVLMMLISSRRLTRLVSTLMDVSRLEAGRLKGSFRLVNLGLVTRDLAVSLPFAGLIGSSSESCDGFAFAFVFVGALAFGLIGSSSESIAVSTTIDSGGGSTLGGATRYAKGQGRVTLC